MSISIVIVIFVVGVVVGYKLRDTVGRIKFEKG